MMTVSGSSQSDIGDINPDNWSNSSIKPSSSVVLQTHAASAEDLTFNVNVQVLGQWIILACHYNFYDFIHRCL